MRKKSIRDVCLIPSYMRKRDELWWRRDFWALSGDHWISINKWQILFIAIEYFLRGRRKLKRHLKLQEENVDGRSIEEASSNARKLGYLA